MNVGEWRPATLLGVFEVVPAAFRSAVIYPHWEFKREEMNLKSWGRDLTELHKLWGSEQNSRKYHKSFFKKTKHLSLGAFKNKGEDQALQWFLGTNNSKEEQFLDSE